MPAVDPNIPQLRVGGRIYTDFLDLEVSREVDRMSSRFVVHVAERWTDGAKDPWQIRRFDPFTLSFGNDLVLTGYVDAYRPEFDRASHNVEIVGRSKTQDIIDCTPDLPGGQFAGYKLDAIARAIAAPFGIGVIVQADVGDAFPDATIYRHEKGFEFLERLARLRSVLLADDEQGRLVLTTAGSTRATDKLEQGKNIERASGELNGANMFSEYRVKTQAGVGTALPDVKSIATYSSTEPMPPTDTVASQASTDATDADAVDVPQTQAVTVTSGIAYDHSVPRFRPHVIIAESALSADLAQKRAEWQAKYNNARGTQITIEVAGWRQSDGSLWKTNTLATVTSKFLQVDAELLIAGVTYSLRAGGGSGGGRRTRLRLGPVGGYQPDPGQVKAKKGGKGSAPDWNGVNSIAGS